MNPANWTSLADWILSLRARNQEARAGKLEGQELIRYQQDCDLLSKALLIAQRLAVKPGHSPRQTLRVAVALDIELVFKDRRERATTVDLGLGGFSALFPQPINVLEQVEFSLVLSRAGGTVGGLAHVVNLQRKGRPYRVAFAFDNLSAADSERIGVEVFEAALASIPPR